jgi:hypothetical protein
MEVVDGTPTTNRADQIINPVVTLMEVLKYHPQFFPHNFGMETPVKTGASVPNVVGVRDILQKRSLCWNTNNGKWETFISSSRFFESKLQTLSVCKFLLWQPVQSRYLK